MPGSQKQTAKRHRLARFLLFACAAWLIGLGIYFALWRPALLPEDVRFIGPTANAVLAFPGLSRWLHIVFTVLGGFMAATGFLTARVAGRWDREGPLREDLPLVAAGLSGVTLMSGANLMIGSDFRWLLIAPPILWATALLCRWR